MSRILVKEVGEQPQIMETEKKYRTDACREHIFPIAEEYAGMDYVILAENENCLITVGVDGNGLAKNLKTNFLIETSSRDFPIQKIFGRCVFTKIKRPGTGEIYDYELEDLSEQDVKNIYSILNPKYQKYLRENFNDYGSGYAIIRTL